MYNAEVKIAYLKTIKSPEERVIEKSKLTKATFYEELIGKDVAHMTTEQLLDMYCFFNLSSLPSLKGYHYVVQRYVKWCVSQGLVEPSATLASENITMEMLDQCISPFRKTSKYIEHEIVHDLTEELANPMDKAIIQGIYNGICGEGVRELILLRREHIDMNNELVSVPYLKKDGTVGISRIIPIPKKVLQTFVEAFSADTYVDFKNRHLKVYGNGLIKRFNNSGGDCLSTGDEIIQARRRITERLKKFGAVYGVDNLTVQALKISGIVYCIKKEASNYGMTDTEIVASDKFESIKNKFGIKTDNQMFLKRYKDYLS